MLAMKLIMTLLVRNEEDIIKENLDFHLSQGVDFFIVTDNKSIDSTTEILKEYEDKGLLHYIYQEEDDYNQHNWVTKMARMAHTDFNADWIINNDADEFWWPLKGSLKSTFISQANRTNVIVAQRHNFVPVKQNVKFYEHMIYRESESINYLGQALPPKVAHKANSRIYVNQGNHSVSGFWRQSKAHNQIEILHFPIRSYSQFLNKIKYGGAAYERNSTLEESVGNAWRKLYSEYKKELNLEKLYNNQVHDLIRTHEALDKGGILFDNRLKTYLNKLYK